MGFVSAAVPAGLGHASLQSKKAESVKKKHAEAQARPNPSTLYTYPSAPTSPASDAVFFGRELQQSVVKTLRVQKSTDYTVGAAARKVSLSGRGGGGSQAADRDTKKALFPNEIKK